MRRPRVPGAPPPGLTAYRRGPTAIAESCSGWFHKSDQSATTAGMYPDWYRATYRGRTLDILEHIGKGRPPIHAAPSASPLPGTTKPTGSWWATSDTTSAAASPDHGTRLGSVDHRVAQSLPDLDARPRWSPHSVYRL